MPGQTTIYFDNQNIHVNIGMVNDKLLLLWVPKHVLSFDIEPKHQGPLTNHGIVTVNESYNIRLWNCQNMSKSGPSSSCVIGQQKCNPSAKSIQCIMIGNKTNGSCSEKPRTRSFRPGTTQSSLFSHID